jgi:hypothetical protein
MFRSLRGPCSRCRCFVGIQCAILRFMFRIPVGISPKAMVLTESLVSTRVQKRLPRKLERCLPCQDWWTLFPSLPRQSTRRAASCSLLPNNHYDLEPSTRAPLYSSQQIRDFTREYSALHTSQERTACVDRQRARTFAINKVSYLYAVGI